MIASLGNKKALLHVTEMTGPGVLNAGFIRSNENLSDLFPLTSIREPLTLSNIGSHGLAYSCENDHLSLQEFLPENGSLSNSPRNPYLGPISSKSSPELSVKSKTNQITVDSSCIVNSRLNLQHVILPPNCTISSIPICHSEIAPKAIFKFRDPTSKSLSINADMSPNNDSTESCKGTPPPFEKAPIPSPHRKHMDSQFKVPFSIKLSRAWTNPNLRTHIIEAELNSSINPSIPVSKPVTRSLTNIQHPKANDNGQKVEDTIIIPSNLTTTTSFQNSKPVQTKVSTLKTGLPPSVRFLESQKSKSKSKGTMSTSTTSYSTFMTSVESQPTSLSRTGSDLDLSTVIIQRDISKPIQSKFKEIPLTTTFSKGKKLNFHSSESSSVISDVDFQNRTSQPNLKVNPLLGVKLSALKTEPFYNTSLFSLEPEIQLPIQYSKIKFHRKSLKITTNLLPLPSSLPLSPHSFISPSSMSRSLDGPNRQLKDISKDLYNEKISLSRTNSNSLKQPSSLPTPFFRGSNNTASRMTPNSTGSSPLMVQVQGLSSLHQLGTSPQNQGILTSSVGPSGNPTLFHMLDSHSSHSFSSTKSKSNPNGDSNIIKSAIRLTAWVKAQKENKGSGPVFEFKTTEPIIAVYIGNDDDYLQKSAMRKIFEVNALEEKDWKLFDIPREVLEGEGTVYCSSYKYLLSNIFFPTYRKYCFPWH